MGREAVAEAVSLGAALASRESVVEEEEDENPTADGKPVHRMARPIALTRQAKKERCAGAHADDDQEMKMSGSCLLSDIFNPTLAWVQSGFQRSVPSHFAFRLTRLQASPPYISTC